MIKYHIPANRLGIGIKTNEVASNIGNLVSLYTEQQFIAPH